MNSTAQHTENTDAVQTCTPVVSPCAQHIIVIGAGPAGIRFTHEILMRQPNARVTLFGSEPYLPYNRVQLSALLAGDIKYEDIVTPLPQQTSHPNFHHHYLHVKKINPAEQTITDEHNQTHSYDALVMATGSRPHVPNIPGVEQTGVYTFRNLKDAEHLYGRVARARHVVVVGGGLLGLEAARALQRANTKITVIQQGSHLMNRQLNTSAAELLQKKVESLGIHLITQSGVRNILGDGRVTSVITRDDETVECDTVLLCAGIKPAVELAREARLKISTGILVNDALETSQKNIYAIGECCEHRGKTYGLVNPGFEQAAICADVLTQGSARYVGSLEVSRLKVLGETVCSMGEVANIAPRPFLRQWSFQQRNKGIYRNIVTHKGTLIGAVGFGEWPEIRRIQEAYQNKRRIYPWQTLRFLITGSLWSNSDDKPALWPPTTVVCQCNNITQGQLVAEMDKGALSVALLSKITGAGTVCGSCKPLLESLTGQVGPKTKEIAWAPTLIASLLTLVIALIITVTPGITVSDTVLQPSFLEGFWNNKFWKQVTGFSLLGLSAIGLAMSMRKRIKKINWGNYAYWRFAHIALGATCAGLLITHTGLHMGESLNRWLIVNFLSVLALGAMAGAAISLSHTLSSNNALRLKRALTWGHILIVWPLPILLIAHILSVYYF